MAKALQGKDFIYDSRKKISRHQILFKPAALTDFDILLKCILCIFLKRRKLLEDKCLIKKKSLLDFLYWGKIHRYMYCKWLSIINSACTFSFLIFQNSASLTDSGISESGDNECEEALLSKLRSLAQDLQQQLTPKSNIVQEITQVRKLAAVCQRWERLSFIFYDMFFGLISWIGKNVLHLCIRMFALILPSY